MPTATHAQPDSAAHCPTHGAAPSPSVLQPHQRLVLPRYKSVVVQYAQNEAGQHELHLFYLDKEICFDQPELFAFAETLAAQSHFVACDALGWGHPGDWPRVRDQLQQLIDEGVLRHADERDLAPRFLGEVGARASPLKPAQTERPRSWHECPGLMAELSGRPLEIGYLELVVPIFRVAQLSMDSEGRQVGESNAFPAALRVDLPTRWRARIYSGARYLDDKPMNVSALTRKRRAAPKFSCTPSGGLAKPGLGALMSMRADWGPMMAMLLKVRQAFLGRCPEARAGWTVGHLQRMSTAVLALPALQLMRRERRVENGCLHPVLSSMHRVTDGLRMTMQHMLLIPFGEPTRKPDTPITSAEVHAYAERAFSLHSDHGVCAGPKVMIDEFLSVLVDGQMPRNGLPATLDAELQEAVADIETAIDYAMLGLQAYAAVFSHWPIMMRTYEDLHAIVQAWALAEPSPAVLAARRWLQPVIARLRGSTHLATEAWRADRELVYGDMYAQCERMLGGVLALPSLAELLAPRAVAPDTLPVRRLRAAIERHFGAGAEGAARDFRAQWQACLLQYFVQAQAVVRVACDVQRQTNRLLGRTPPTQRFQVADIDIYVQLDGNTEGRVPFLLDELARVFGVQVDIDRDGMQIKDRMVAP